MLWSEGVFSENCNTPPSHASLRVVHRDLWLDSRCRQLTNRSRCHTGRDNLLLNLLKWQARKMTSIWRLILQFGVVLWMSPCQVKSIQKLCLLLWFLVKKFPPLTNNLHKKMWKRTSCSVILATDHIIKSLCLSLFLRLVDALPLVPLKKYHYSHSILPFYNWTWDWRVALNWD